MYSAVYSEKGKYTGVASRGTIKNSKLMLRAALLISATIGFGSSADAALVNVTFNGKFATGEDLTGKIVYDAVGTSSTDEFVEFRDVIKSFAVTSSKFITTNGVDTLNGIGGFDNRIRYGSGSLGEYPGSAGSNTLQFIQSSDGKRGFFGELTYISISISVPVRTFITGQLPSSFSFDSGSNIQIGFGYDYYTGSGFSYERDSANAAISSITAIPAISAVPEPATWMTMLGGFALVGGGMRVRRRRVVMAV